MVDRLPVSNSSAVYRVGFNADPDPAFSVKADPDPDTGFGDQKF